MLKVYNTLTRQKEVFEPINPPYVKMYACGITVSGEAHIGHAFQALIYDIIRKYLNKKGFSTTYARNYTDVDDKIIAASIRTGIPADKYAQMMIEKIDHEMRRLEVDDPDIWLKATENIQNIIEFVKELIETGHAYSTPSGDVYFAVESFKEYGKLSNRNLDDAIAGVRIEAGEEKKYPLDFALWKSAKPGEISWDSPWGKGRPGWHIECSCMNRVAFGEQIDIHGGGRDLVFPHHENEIAQTEALTGKQFAKYWIHNGLIKINGQKMSKSLGNSLLLSDLLDKYSPESIKFALLSTNYRNDINLSDEVFDGAEKSMYDFYKVVEKVESMEGENLPSELKINEDFDTAMDDDFNTSRALANLYGYFKTIRKKIANGDLSAKADVLEIRKVYALLGLFTKDAKEFIEFVDKKKEGAVPEEIMQLVEKRTQAKKERNFALADEIRNELDQKGYMVLDTKDGVKVSKK